MWSEILAPGLRRAWAKDRQALWSAVHRVEHRCDAQLAREVEVALPLALSPPVHCELLREWVGETFVSAGMVADVCYHAKRGNPHAHILLTLRDIDANGFGKKNRAWNNLGLVESWRASWAAVVNRYLEKGWPRDPDRSPQLQAARSRSDPDETRRKRDAVEWPESRRCEHGKQTHPDGARPLATKAGKEKVGGTHQTARDRSPRHFSRLHADTASVSRASPASRTRSNKSGFVADPNLF